MDGILHVPIDDSKCGVDQKRIDNSAFPSHPKYIQKREVLEAGDFIEGMPQEKRDLLPLLQQGVQETIVFRQIFFPVWGREAVSWIEGPPGNKLVRDRVVAILIEWKSASPQKSLEVDTVQNA